MFDHPVEHPSHYTSMSCVIEPIQLTGTMNGALAQILQYVLRHEHKGTPKQDLEKALFWAKWFRSRYFKQLQETTVPVQSSSASFEDVAIREAWNQCFHCDNELTMRVVDILTRCKELGRGDIDALILELEEEIKDMELRHEDSSAY